MKKIRTRFAPSPTGSLHVGGLRTALYNYLFAKHNKGNFILRIEDTDKTRFVEGSMEGLIDILNLMNLNYSEGVFTDKENKIIQKGNFKPYLQSERLSIYKKYINELIDKKYAYYCFCSSERLTEMRKKQQAAKIAPMYDGQCRELNNEKIQEMLAKKIPYVVRLKIPKDGFTEFKDLVYGKIRIENKTIDDQVIMKSDGYPTYHLASVVDDYLMKISHVIRGEEWLPSTPKHILLYKAFGWELPNFAHLPLLLNSDKSKLSKRQGDVATKNYLSKGYLPEALLNFVLLLGWNPKTEEEIFSLEEMIKRFNLSGVNKTGAIFNVEKLDWINGAYIRKMKIEKLTKLCIPYLIEAKIIKREDTEYRIQDTNELIDFEYLKKVIKLEQDRMKKINEIGELINFIFVSELKYKKDLLIWKKISFEEVNNNLKLAYGELEKIKENNFTKDNLEKILRNLMEEKNIKIGELLWPLRVALTGLEKSPSPFEVGEVLGRKKVLGRIEFALNLLR